MPKVLLIEDDLVQIEIVKNRLESAGYDVLVARNGPEGIALAREERPGLILMDMIMPGMHGLEATIKLKEIPETKDIPVIALTALSSPKFVEECYKAGIITYFKKPYEFKKLLDSVDKLLGEQKEEKTILVMAGESVFVTMLEMSLIRQKYKVMHFSEVQAGIEEMEKSPSHLILLDVSFSDPICTQVIEKTASVGKTRKIPVILLSSWMSSEELKEKVSKMGAVDFVSAPFDSAEFIRKVRTALKSS